MTRKLTLTIEVTDEEAANLLARFNGTARPVDAAVDGQSAAPVAAPTMPTTAAAPVAAPAVPGAVDVDKNGVPWLEAVHASSKAKNADGSWRGRKGVSKEERDAAEAAVKASASGAFTVPASLTGGSGPVVLNTDPAPTMPAAAPAMPPMPQQMPAQMPAQPVFAPPPVQPVSFEDVLVLYNNLAGAGKITPQHLFQIYADNGFADGNAEIQTNESARRKVFDALQAFNQ